ncbi:uncharacterized protein BYT42DRAFT_564400 [Radiomyces spectabilis]|uniref:uncharacterized protein n=1 Tax=Radiomyces spectabilis TaxID=64574 RepID=UPI00221F07A3|nr:uncharacterized protein BYT42DRAFT_564400 [Radiomyces spectabilis]KAI8385009.1 hypothetical protein BYT42DRAFT_564400 [Radiomyces spectabilis]
MPHYLGLDLSTQQLKCTVINSEHRIIAEDAVNFDNDLPEFGTVHGAIIHGDVATSPPMMWIKALDMLLERLAAKNVVNNICGIAGDAQQHASVYWSAKGVEALKNLDPSQPLTEQFSNAFSRAQSPIWQDASTTKECRALEQFVGGDQALANLTGSKAYERFTGNQIAKFYHNEKEAYDATQYIQLVSSFLASLLLGNIAPVDANEGSGTNMMNIMTHRWDKDLVDFCGGKDLYGKLALEPTEGGVRLGQIAPYYVKRYGFNPECVIMPFTGDNAATLSSMNLRSGDCVVSLGTSDTVLVYLKKQDAVPTTEAHLMAHPTDPEGFMGMICYKNGSLARQRIRDLYANGSWDTFNEYLGKPCKEGQIGFYYWMQEIVPFAKGIHRFENGQPVEEFSEPQTNVPAILESQFFSMLLRVKYMMPLSKVRRILATGGASVNKNLLQVLSDVFGLPVYKSQGTNSASLGGALLAKYGMREDKNMTLEEMVNQTQGDDLDLICQPNLERTKLFKEKLSTFERLENEITKR